MKIGPSAPCSGLEVDAAVAGRVWATGHTLGLFERGRPSHHLPLSRQVGDLSQGA